MKRSFFKTRRNWFNRCKSAWISLLIFTLFYWMLHICRSCLNSRHPFSELKLPETAHPMKSPDFFTSSCRHCRHYSPEGRRGGHCHQLNVPVQGAWQACSLAIPMFQPTWNFQKISIWQDETPQAFPTPLSVQTSVPTEDTEVEVTAS